MAQLEILQCSGCGSPLAPGALTCEYCGSKNIIKSKRNPLKVTSDIAREYIGFYSGKTRENPKDGNALYAMGLLYLNLKNYELAERNFKDAIDRSPLDPDVYYYYALSILAGKSIRAVSAKDVGRAEQYLGTAIGMETKCKYLVLLAVVREEYYVLNQLVVRGDTPRELFGQAKDYTPEDLDEITGHCILCGENTLYNIDLLTGRQEAGAGTDCGDGEGAGDPDEEEAEAAYCLTEARRRQYYDHRFEPARPGYSDSLPDGIRLRTKGSYTGFILGRLWQLVLCSLLSVILFTVCFLAGLGFFTTEHSLEAVSVEEIVALKEGGMNRKLPAKERAALTGQLKSDSVETAQQYEKLAAENFRLQSRTDEENQTREVLWLKKTAGGYIWFMVVISPFLFWIITGIGKAKRVAESRRAVDLHNRDAWDIYNRAVESYDTKPTPLQMTLFIRKYLSQIVDMELSFHNKSEEELKGKTLFLNEFFNYEEDGADYGDSAVEYTVVFLEADCVSVITADWRVYEDSTDTGTIESISYSDIKEVKLTGHYLSFGGITIDIPDGQVFVYQNTDPGDGLTFSNKRTSDVRQFAIALRKLHTAYKNSK